MLTNTLHLKLYGNKQLRKKRIRCLKKVVEGIWKRRKFGYKMRKKFCGKKEKYW
jgi:hypothetical protein